MWSINIGNNMTDRGPQKNDPIRAARQAQRLKKRYRKELRFRAFGMSAVLLATGILAFLMTSIVYTSIPAFTHHNLTLDVTIIAEEVDILRDDQGLVTNVDANWLGFVRTALRDSFPEVTSRRDKRDLYKLLSIGAPDAVRDAVQADPNLIGQTIEFSLPLSDDIDLVMKGLINRYLPEN